MILPILTYPNEILGRPSHPVNVIDSTLVKLAGDMIETMYAAKGVGLAAPQVGKNIALVVLDISEERDQPLVLINPYLEKHSTEKETEGEGCLSVPGITVEVERPAVVVVSAQGLKGEDLLFEADGLLARCLQHEMDHLDGLLLISKTTAVERFRVREELLELEESSSPKVD